jgi:hypothetical protein
MAATAKAQWGAGIAKTFKARYCDMFEEYRKRCKAEPRRF